MEKTVIFCLLLSSLYAFDDYIPVSEISNDKKVEYNFMNSTNNTTNQKLNKEEKFEPVKSKSNSTKKEEFQAVKSSESIELKKEILQEVKSGEIKENNPTVDKNFVKDYKKENILQDTKQYSQNSLNKDFSITPKITYSYLKADFFATDRVSVVDKKGVFIPEITASYKNHNLKAEGFEIKSYFNKVLIGGSDLETTIKWNKLYYLYSFNNINLGIAYNSFDIKFDAVNDNVILKDQQEFPSLELHMKNSNEVLQTEYGFSYGKNNDISYSYEYYLNIGYKLLKDNELILSAGYKNRTIEYNFPEKDTDYKYEFEGPTLSLVGTF